MIKIVICDDEKLELSKALKFTKEYSELHSDVPMSISTFSNPLEMMDYIDKNGGFDLYMLDIIMDGMKGVDVAKEIKMRQEGGEIVFMTSSKDYAVDAFALNAIHYLVKPYDKKNFDEALDRAVNKALNSQPRYLIRNTDKGLMRILLNNICYTESSGHYQYIHLFNNEVLKIRSKTDDLWGELKNYPQFIKPHSGYIVNMDYIKNVTSFGLSVNSVNLPLTKNTYSKVKKIYLDYVFNSTKQV